jgi:hypothetical protein
MGKGGGMKAQTRIAIALAIGMLALCGCPADVPNTDPLALEMTCRESNGAVQLHVTLRNSGANSTAVVLGLESTHSSTLEGRKPFPGDWLKLDVETSGLGATQELEYHDLSRLSEVLGGIRPGDWVVSLPPSSEFSIMLPLGYFVSRDLRTSAADLPKPFRARLRLTWRKELPGLAPVFLGELKSKWLSIPNDCQRG